MMATQKRAKKKKQKTLLEKIREGIATEARSSMQYVLKEGIKEITEALRVVSEFEIEDDELHNAIDEYIAEALRQETSYAYFEFGKDGVQIDLRIGEADEHPYSHIFLPDNFDSLGNPYSEYGGPKSQDQLDDVKSRLKLLNEFIAQLSNKRDELKAAVDNAVVVK
jgi:hypothetical protein